MRHRGMCGPWSGFRGWHRQWLSKDELLEILEEYQRDLEQELADVAERIKRIREEETEKV